MIILELNIEVQHILFSNLNFKLPIEIPVVFHNGSHCDYRFVIKESANEFEGQFECLRK